jgi:pimeloyl-ACP methyl ester carboxylesterase
MKEAVVRGIRINYEVVGDDGSWVALTPGSRRSYAELVPLAQTIAAGGFRVLLHDRRNCGSSEVAVQDLGSEHDIWADDLHELCAQLGALPVYAGGSSAGARLAILFALRHRESVKGLALWRVTGGSAAAEELAEMYYGQYIKLVQSGGMEAVCRSEHFAACIAARPANRENLMRMDPDEFIRIMSMWRQKFLEAANLPIIGATDDQLRSITVPVCLIAGNDRIHPPAIARKVNSLLPTSEMHDDVVAKYPDSELLPEWDPKEWKEKESVMAGLFVDFLRRAEARASKAAV